MHHLRQKNLHQLLHQIRHHTSHRNTNNIHASSENQGYLLIEVLIALVLAATLLTALITLQLRFMGDSRLVSERGLAAMYAEAGAENLLSAIRAGAVIADEHEDLWPALTSTGSDAGFEYRRRWSLASAFDLSTAQISVSWPEYESEPSGADSAHQLTFSISAQTNAAIDSGQAAVSSAHVISP